MEKSSRSLNIYLTNQNKLITIIFNKTHYDLPYLPVNKAIIINTHTSNLGGEHWLAVYHKPDKIYVFDSFGFYYPSILVTHLSRMSKPIVYNKIRYQDPFSTTCGQHCLLWLKKQHYS